MFVWFTHQNDWDWWVALLATLTIVIVFRGFADLLFRRLIPWPSLFGLESQTLREEDIVGRRRAWFWRFWFKVTILFITVVTIVWIFRGGTWLDTVGFIFDGIGTILSSPTLWIQAVFVFFLFFANFAIMFGPLLLMNMSQMQSFEPGDAEWGVKLEDVRGQVEAKEEVRRVVDIWQSGEQFERAGGKRERGLLLFGAPGTGKTMLAKAIATGFNSPFISMPGSGFAATFIGIDAIIVRLLARRAKKLARKWGGQCIVFIDEIDAVGMRRQSLGTGSQGFITADERRERRGRPLLRPVGLARPLRRPDRRDDGRGATACSSSAPRSRTAYRVACTRGSASSTTSCSPADGRNGRRARPQPAPRRHGRDRQPAVDAAHLHEQAEHDARRELHRPAPGRQREAAPAGRTAAE